MGIAKKTFLATAGLILMLMFLSYGLDLILSINGIGGVATYLKSSTYTTSYGFTFIKYNWDYISYANNLTKAWQDNFLMYWYNHVNPTILAEGWERAFSYAIPPSNVWEALLNAVKYMINVIINIINLLVYITNVPLLALHNLVNMIVIWIFSLIGVNMEYGSWWLANVFQWQIRNLWIPFIPSV